MAKIPYTYYRQLCPKCGKGLRRGIRQFGPAEVTCGHCQSVVSTGLSSWSTQNTGRKTWIAVSEILWPSWINMKIQGCLNRIVVGPLLVIGIYGIPMGIVAGVIYGLSSGIGAIFGNPQVADVIVPFGMLAGVFAFPLMNAIRLAGMIRESRVWEETKKPPLWKSNV